MSSLNPPGEPRCSSKGSQSRGGGRQQRLTTILVSVVRSFVNQERSRFSKVLYQRGSSSAPTGFPTLRERDAEFFFRRTQREGGLRKLRRTMSAIAF